VEITDKGRGIARELQEIFFKPYKRVEGKKHMAELGLGLALCKTFVELHGGKFGL
jgi:signal transduction histidine kinase